ncbi:MAG: EamA family transporter [Eubacteriales bacterium]
MWIIFAFASALFAGLTSILAKCGIKNTDSNVATAIRTVVILIFSWIMVFVAGVSGEIYALNGRTMFFLILSGLATGGSWLCYFKALQLGDINKVTPIDKSSTVLTMVLAILFLEEALTAVKLFAMILISLGTYWMIEKKETSPDKTTSNAWLFYAFASAIFASCTSILGKVGMEGVNATLGTAIRTIVVLVMAWMMVFMTKKQKTIKEIDKQSWLFLILSGIATGLSWLCYYSALQLGPASVVVPIDKLSMVVTIGFSYFIFHEKLSKKGCLGFIFIIVGTLALLF